MRRRARLGRYFTFARQSPVTFLSGTKDAFSNGDRHRLYLQYILLGPVQGVYLAVASTPAKDLNMEALSRSVEIIFVDFLIGVQVSLLG